MRRVSQILINNPLQGSTIAEDGSKFVVAVNAALVDYTKAPINTAVTANTASPGANRSSNSSNLQELDRLAIEFMREILSHKGEGAPPYPRSFLVNEAWEYLQRNFREKCEQIAALEHENRKLKHRLATNSDIAELQAEVRYQYHRLAEEAQTIKRLRNLVEELEVNHAQQIAELKAEMTRQVEIENRRPAQTRPGRRKLRAIAEVSHE